VRERDPALPLVLRKAEALEADPKGIDETNHETLRFL
jgi:hypothetical protein